MRAALLVSLALASSACQHRTPRPDTPKSKLYQSVGNRPDNAPTDTPPSDLSTTALKQGAKVTSVELRDQAGHPWSIADAARGHKHLVIVFYRGDWCQFCRAQLAEIQAHLDDFTKKDAVLAAVSVDGPDTSAHLADGLGLTFPLVSDPGHKMIAAFGVFDGQTEIAWPSVFIVDSDASIDWRWVADDFKERIATLDVIGALGRDDATPATAAPLR